MLNHEASLRVLLLVKRFYGTILSLVLAIEAEAIALVLCHRLVVAAFFDQLIQTVEGPVLCLVHHGSLWDGFELELIRLRGLMKASIGRLAHG